MASDVNISEFFSKESAEHWPSAYALDERFTSDAHHPLAHDIPTQPMAAIKAQGCDKCPPECHTLGESVTTQLFLSRGPTSTQLHRDPFDNVYAVAFGKRRWYICPPGADSSGLLLGADLGAISASRQPLPGSWSPAATEATTSAGGAAAAATGFVRGGFSSWSPDAPWAAMASGGPNRPARGGGPPSFIEVELAPGDGLFLPAGWWHLVRAEPPFSAAVNWYFEPPPLAESGGPALAPKEPPWGKDPAVGPPQRGAAASFEGSAAESKPCAPPPPLPPPPRLRAPPGSVSVVPGGDLLSAAEPFIAHQCNCISSGARGTAKALFQKWPAANVYHRRPRGGSTPGTVDMASIGQQVLFSHILCVC